MMVDSLNDNHPRVQGAALIAMRVLLVDLKPDLESQYHEQIFPALLQQAGDTYNHPRIQACSCYQVLSAYVFACSGTFVYWN